VPLASRADLRSGVRGLLPNVTPDVLSDEALDVALATAIRRLSKDRPHEKSGQITGTGDKFYTLTVELDDWAEGFSGIVFIVDPSPVIADNARLVYLDEDGYEIYDDGTVERLRFERAIGTGKLATIRYTTVWTLNGLDGATATTLRTSLNNALLFISASMACYALASQAAGQTSSGVPGDLINYRSKSREYRSMGQEWEMQYKDELGMREDAPAAAAISRSSYPNSLQNGHPYITHIANRG
jgi:hypothetical protein